MNNTQLAIKKAPMTIEETISVGQILAESGFFDDAKGAAQAVAKILAGQELGFGPMASMTGVYIVRGRIMLSANLLAAAIKRTGKYDYIVRQLNDSACKIAFVELRNGNTFEIGESVFTLEDAKRAGLGGENWKKYPRNMLFARALSNGARWFCPDILGGPVYTPDEFGLPVNEDGEIIDGSVASEPTTGNGRAAANGQWTRDAEAITKMFAEAEKQFGLSQVDVHLALLVDDVRDFQGTKAEAWEMIKAYGEANGTREHGGTEATEPADQAA